MVRIINLLPLSAKRLQKKEKYIKKVSRRTASWLYPLIYNAKKEGVPVKMVSKEVGRITRVGKEGEETSATSNEVLVGRAELKNLHNPDFPVITPESVIVHELTHAFGEKNHYLTANAYEGYIRLKKSLRLEKGAKRFIPTTPEKIIGLIEKAAKINLNEKEMNKIEDLYKAEHEAYYPQLEGYSINQLGRALSRIAVIKERTLRKPGAGLIFIREVSHGKSLRTVEEDLKGGKYDKELADLLGANARLRKTVR